MQLRKLSSAGLASAAMLVLILDSRTALLGASEGILLCIRTVIPSLFPFLFLCSLLTNALWGGNHPILRLLGKPLGIPDGAESLLIAASLGGYPAGAQAIGDAFQAGKLTQADAAHLLTFCSNAGPAFLFGMTAVHFSHRDSVWALWCIQILSFLITGTLDGHCPRHAVSLEQPRETLSQILSRTVKTTAILCGWIVLFRIFTALLDRWLLWYFPVEIQVLITGFLELSNGCCRLSLIREESLRFVMCGAFLSFGGLCVGMQTQSVIGRLSMGSYIRGKLLQTMICILLAALYVSFGWKYLLLIGGMLLILPGIMKKRSSIPELSGV